MCKKFPSVPAYPFVFTCSCAFFTNELSDHSIPIPLFKSKIFNIVFKNLIFYFMKNNKMTTIAQPYNLNESLNAIPSVMKED